MESVSAKLQKGVKLHNYEPRCVSNVEILNANVIINSVQVNYWYRKQYYHTLIQLQYWLITNVEDLFEKAFVRWIVIYSFSYLQFPEFYYLRTCALIL